MAIALLLLLAVAALVVLNDWRWTVPLLLAAELSRIALIWRGAGMADAPAISLLLAELATALGVAAILLVTALTLARDYATESLDEFALLELRRAARRAQQQRSQVVGRWSGAVVPLGALAIAGVATWLLGRAYPVAHDPLLNAAWVFMLLSGLLLLIMTNNVLKLGMGLLLLVASAKLLYFGVATRVLVLHVGLLELLSLLLAVIVAYLSGLLYGRLRTLEIDGLFERR